MLVLWQLSWSTITPNVRMEGQCQRRFCSRTLTSSVVMVTSNLYPVTDHVIAYQRQRMKDAWTLGDGILRNCRHHGIDVRTRRYGYIGWYLTSMPCGL
ncbi:predicted protein [Lichtheimia corymbifera JMRC:FSU:9682]|uniref:Uncharacterized protein n=1 Tax=Lichtheimia corymbifera JMRC:FSU:9682 TaxID=1263082 RepID=A0A068S0T2_9FUNG|nr:predicted protein [Lichtheimia corymbifera JMRC:FSU:9682]